MSINRVINRAASEGHHAKLPLTLRLLLQSLASMHCPQTFTKLNQWQSLCWQSLNRAINHVQGLLLPLCQSGDCNLREAVIVSSVLKRVSLPVLHSAAALLRIADMAYSGTNSFFIRVLLDKKYALPYRVVSALHLFQLWSVLYYCAARCCSKTSVTLVGADF